MWPLKTAPSSANKVGYSENPWIPALRPGQGFLKTLSASVDAFYGFLYRYGLELLFFGSLIYFAWALWTMDYSQIGSGG